MLESAGTFTTFAQEVSAFPKASEQSLRPVIR